MSDKKERVVSYRYVEWVISDPKSISLMACFNEAIKKRPTSDLRTVSYNGQLLTLASYKLDGKEGIYLHITVETPGESASVVPRLKLPVDKFDVGTAPPPEDSEFMDGDAFLYIRGNHLFLCATNVQDETVRRFLTEYFKAAEIRDDSDKFVLTKKADLTSLQLLKKEGVKEIELAATMYEATAHYQARKNQAFSVLGSASKAFKTLVGTSEHDVNEDGLRVAITIKSDGRRKGLKMGEKRLESFGTNLIKTFSSDYDFTVITKKGKRISPDEIFVKSRASISASGKSVDVEDAWDALREFYAAVASSGILEQ